MSQLIRNVLSSDESLRLPDQAGSFKLRASMFEETTPGCQADVTEYLLPYRSPGLS